MFKIIEGDFKNNKYSDYYIWRDPKIGEDGKKMPPNNWISFL